MNPIAEVIASSTRQFVAEVYEETAAPSLGAWLRVQPADAPTIYAVVSHVEIGSYDGNRQPVALGMSAEERDRELPMVRELIRTTVRAHILACEEEEGRIRQTLPPTPPDLHDFVALCPDDVVQRVGPPYDFLRTLVQSPDPAVPVDDLLVAVLRGIHRAHGGEHGGRGALVTAGRSLSRLLDDDHERLQSILRRVM